MWVTFDELAPGMVLAGEVRDARGMLLVPVGAALSERHLRVMELAGLAGAEVEAPAGDAEDEAEARARLEAVTAALAPLFAEADRSHPLVGALFDWCVRRQLRTGGAAA